MRLLLYTFDTYKLNIIAENVRKTTKNFHVRNKSWGNHFLSPLPRREVCKGVGQLVCCVPPTDIYYLC